MRYLTLFLLPVIGLFLSGCVTVTGESDYVPYSVALSAHSASESARVATQSQAITNSLLAAKTETPTERALLSVIAILQISQLQPTPLNIVKPTTGYDVLNRHLGSIISTTAIGATSYFAWDTVSEIVRGAGNVFNGDVIADGSFNTTENHITGSDGGSLTNSGATNKPVTTMVPAEMEKSAE